jgi:hypothetical protein
MGEKKKRPYCENHLTAHAPDGAPIMNDRAPLVMRSR